MLNKFLTHCQMSDRLGNKCAPKWSHEVCAIVHIELLCVNLPNMFCSHHWVGILILDQHVYMYYLTDLTRQLTVFQHVSRVRLTFPNVPPKPTVSIVIFTFLQSKLAVYKFIAIQVGVSVINTCNVITRLTQQCREMKITSKQRQGTTIAISKCLT